MLHELLEVAMVVLFGISWPFSVVKSYRSRSTKGKSLLFLCLVLVGYCAGILSKLLNPEYLASFSTKWYILFFYVLNFCMIFADFLLYFRNRAIEKQNGS